MSTVQNRRIIFTAPNTAELLSSEIKHPGAGDVLVKMCSTAISAGTERANLIGESNVSGAIRDLPVSFPRYSGYSGTGIVSEIGAGVKNVKPGDRVLAYWGSHSEYNIFNANKVVSLPDNIPMRDGAFIFISTFSLAGVRKTGVEIGESGMVMGLGLLGLFSVQYLKLSGAIPVIACDPNPARRELALSLGADYAFDPTEEGFAERVKKLTGGVNAIVEVSGRGDALIQALSCASPMARVALLGCTRHSVELDLYHDVHYPGVSLIGAHTMARPQLESYPHHWTHIDDCNAAIKFISAGRFNIHDMLTEVHSPVDAPEVFTRLAFDKNFPIGVSFDWTLLKQEVIK